MAQAPERPEGPTGGTRPGRHGPDTREIVRLVGFGVALVLLIAFVVGNSNSVRVNVVFFHTTTSLIWVILVSAVLGLLVDRLIILLARRRGKQRDTEGER